MSKEWRPEGWTQPYNPGMVLYVGSIPVNLIDYYEAGASAMLKVLREKAKDDGYKWAYSPTSDFKGNKGIYVFIPDDEEA